MVERSQRTEVVFCDCGRHAGKHERQTNCCDCPCHGGGALHIMSCHCYS